MACACTDTTPCGELTCGCKFKVDAGCITYSGEDLAAAGFVSGDSLTTILTTLNQKFVDYGPGDYVTMTTEAPGSHCTYGGLRLDLRSGQTNVIKSTQYLCGVNTNVQDLSLYVKRDGTTSLTGDWNAGLSRTISVGSIYTDNDSNINTVNIGLGGNNIPTNTIVGNSALINNTTGGYNIAIGSESLKKNTTGEANTSVGYLAMHENLTGLHNIAIGYTAMVSNTTGSFNTAIGNSTLSQNIAGDSNAAIGYRSLFQNTTGIANTSFGANSLPSNTAGSYNLALGNLAAHNNTTGNFNVAVGYGSFFNNTTGAQNIAIGTALVNNTIGDHNIGIGAQALANIQDNNYNIGIGNYAGAYLNNGVTANTGTRKSTYIGYQTRASAIDAVNEIAIGADSRGNGTNTTTIGSYNTTAFYLHGDMNLLDTTAPTTAAVTQTKYLPITINGTSYKLLLAD
jgi:hypothetical protein